MRENDSRRIPTNEELFERFPHVPEPRTYSVAEAAEDTIGTVGWGFAYVVSYPGITLAIATLILVILILIF